MRYGIFSLVVFLLVQINLYSQQGPFLRKLSKSGFYQMPVEVFEQPDGGTLIFSSNRPETFSFESPGYISVIKTRENGEILWSKEFSDTLLHVIAVERTQDDGFILLSGKHLLTLRKNFRLIKIDSTGNELWSFDYNKSSGLISPTQIISTSDQSYLILAKEDTLTSLIKIDSSGTIQWAKHLSLTFSTDPIRFNTPTILRSQSGRIILAGMLQNSAGTDVGITSLDNNGNILWTRKIGILNRKQWPTSLCQLPGSDLILTAKTQLLNNTFDQFDMIFQLDTSGNLLYRESLHHTSGSDIKSVPYGSGYLLYTNGGNNSIYAFDQNHTLLWTTGSGTGSSFLNYILPVGGKDLLCLGENSDHPSDLVFQRVDSAGNTGTCSVGYDTLNFSYTPEDFDSVSISTFPGTAFSVIPINSEETLLQYINSYLCGNSSVEERDPEKEKLQIYPVPASNRITVGLDCGGCVFNISIYDLTGRALYEADAIGRKEVSLECFSAGTLLVNVRTSDTQISRVIIKQ